MIQSTLPSGICFITFVHSPNFSWDSNLTIF